MSQVKIKPYFITLALFVKQVEFKQSFSIIWFIMLSLIIRILRTFSLQSKVDSPNSRDYPELGYSFWLL